MSDDQTQEKKSFFSPSEQLTGKQIVLILIGMLFLCSIFAYFSSPSKPLSKEEERKAFIGKNFSDWDGSHIKLEEYIKKSMNDPKSYEHIETKYWDRDDYLIVQTSFRGKNAFGALVKNQVKAKVGLNGEVIEILESY
jgi:hypothetical protein